MEIIITCLPVLLMLPLTVFIILPLAMLLVWLVTSALEFAFDKILALHNWARNYSCKDLAAGEKGRNTSNQKPEAPLSF